MQLRPESKRGWRPVGEESADYHTHGRSDASLLVDDEEADVVFLSSHLGGTTYTV
jgi:hypothetical protein